MAPLPIAYGLAARRAVCERRSQLQQRLGSHQRRVAKHHENIIGTAGDRLTRREHSVRGSEALALLEKLRVCTENLIRVDEVAESPKLAQ